MKELCVEGDVAVNLPDDWGADSRIVEYRTREQFDGWCVGTGVSGDAMACRYQEQVYVKVPQSLDEGGDFPLDYDCLPLDEANNRIERWSRHNSMEAFLKGEQQCVKAKA